MSEDVTVNTEKSGGTRFSSGKASGWWFLPMYGLKLIAPVAVKGGEKYAPLDWAEGQSFSTLFDCMFRHLLEVQHRGVWALDDGPKGTGLYHLAHAGWNLLCLLTFMAQERHDLDDMTKWRGVTAAQRASMTEGTP